MPGLLDAFTQTWPYRLGQSALSAAKLPGDVYQGRTAPLSDEAIGRSADLAGFMTGAPGGAGGLGSGVRAPHWFDKVATDPYVYHGTQAGNLPAIQNEGLQAFLRNYYGSDPKLAMQYAYRGEWSKPGDPKLPGVLLRAPKEAVDPELARLKAQRDFWTDRGDMPANKLEMRQNNQWVPLAPKIPDLQS